MLVTASTDRFPRITRDQGGGPDRKETQKTPDRASNRIADSGAYGSASARGRERGIRGATPEALPQLKPVKQRIVEFCCGADSLMGNVTPETHGCETIRLTIEDDLRTQEGLETALRAVDAPNGVLLWAAIPCTGGCAWNALNAKRGSEATREKIRGHRVYFWAIWHNFEKVAEATIAKGGYIAIGWPSSCAYWRESRIQELVNKHVCERASIHGCMYGLKSIAPGKSLLEFVGFGPPGPTPIKQPTGQGTLPGQGCEA